MPDAIAALNAPAATPSTILTTAAAAPEGATAPASTPSTTSQDKPGDSVATPATTPPAKPDGQGTDGSAAPKEGEGKTEKAAPEAKPADGADEPLEFKLPEGIPADDEMLAGFKDVAKEAGLKGPQAQKVVDLYVRAMRKEAESAKAEHEARIQTWADSLKTDAELGGKAYTQNVAHAQRGLAKFATPELRTLLNETGLGNHPELVRVFARVGKAMAEDSFSGAGPTAGSVTSDEALVAQLWPNTKFDTRG